MTYTPDTRKIDFPYLSLKVYSPHLFHHPPLPQLSLWVINFRPHSEHNVFAYAVGLWIMYLKIHT